MNYIIIGNGVAGINAALKIREKDFDGRIIIISRETEYFYSRTALMYIAMGDMRLEDTEPFERSFYDQQRIELLQDEVVRIDGKKKIVFLTENPSIEYDKLLLATGANPTTFGWPGLDLHGVTFMVSYQHLREIVYHQKMAKTAVVIGAGLIGIEMVEVFLHAGIEVTFIMKGEAFWPGWLTPEEGRFVNKHMESQGVKIITSQTLKAINGEHDHVTSITLEDGTKLPCDILGIATGVTPEIGLAIASGIPCGKGILADSTLETEVRDIYTAGDCAEIKAYGSGKNFNQSIWYSSRDMGQIAGLNMTGQRFNYDPGEWYNSAKFFDMEYTIAGDINPPGKEVKNFHYQDKTRSVRITHDHRKVYAFSMIGSRWNHEVLLGFIREEISLEQFFKVYRKALFDPEFMGFGKLKKAAVK